MDIDARKKTKNATKKEAFYVVVQNFRMEKKIVCYSLQQCPPYEDYSWGKWKPSTHTSLRTDVLEKANFRA